MVVSAEGLVWTFGWGVWGSLGHNNEHDRLVPLLLLEFSKIVTVAS